MGSKIKIQKSSSPSYKERLEKEWLEPQKQHTQILSRKESKKQSTSIHGDNMLTIKDTDPLRMGWKRGKFGRAVCVVNMRANSIAQVTFIIILNRVIQCRLNKLIRVKHSI